MQTIFEEFPELPHGTAPESAEHYRRMFEALREHTRMLETLNRVGSMLSAELDSQKILQTMTDAGTECSGAEFGAFFFNAVNKQGESYLLYTISGVPHSAFEKFPLPRNTPVFDPTFTGKGVVRSDDITKDPRYGQVGPHHGMPPGHLPVRSYLAVPVLSRSGAVHGGLFFGHSRAGVFTERAERLVSGFASFAAIALDNARLYQSVKESEERFRMLADNMSQLAWTCDRDLGNGTWFNRRWLEYTGLSADTVKSWDWSRVHHPDHLERVVEGVKRAVASGTAWEDTFPLRGADGTYRWFLSRAVPIRNDANEIVTWFGTNTDIDSQRRAEQSLEEQRRALAEVDRRKDEFLAMLSHELRNPLAAISNASHVLGYDDNTEEMKHRARGIIERQVDHLAHLVDDLMDVARITTGRIRLRAENIDFNGVVERARDGVVPLLETRRHVLSVDLPATPIFVLADSTRLEQIVGNLLTNAAKYTDEGGRITLSLKEEGGNAVLRVRDNGIGIAAENLDRIFEAFTQIDKSLERERGGLGLGLSIVRNLVQMHRGEVQVSSAGLGHGSEFVVRLPLPESRPGTA